MPEVTPGIILHDRYRINEPIGKGASGTTYRARDLKNGRDVVVKMLHVSAMEDFKSMDLFKREIALLKSIRHPHIPDYIDDFESEADGELSHALVQEYAPGKNLYDQVKSGTRFSPERVTEILKSLLEILRYIHALKPAVIHRDINPKNIILDDNGAVYLVDFGAAGTIRRETLAAARSDTFVGTIGYMPPEQLFGKVLPASDLYALGVTAVFLLTGKEPHELDFKNMKLNYKGHALVPKNLEVFLDMLINPAVEERLESAAQALEILGGGAAPRPALKKRRNRHEFTALPVSLRSLPPPPRPFPLTSRLRLWYQAQKSGTLGTGMFFAAMGMVFAVAFVFSTRVLSSFRLADADATAPGIVLAVEETNSSENDVTVYKNTFRYNPTDTTTLEQYSFTTGREFSAGDKVTVRFVRSDPIFAVIEGARYSTFDVFVLFVLVFPLVGFGMMIAGRPRGVFRSAFTWRHGRLTQATVMNVKTVKARLVVTYAYQTEEGRARTGRLRTANHELGALGKTYPLLYVEKPFRHSWLIDFPVVKRKHTVLPELGTQKMLVVIGTRLGFYAAFAAGITLTTLAVLGII